MMRCPLIKTIWVITVALFLSTQSLADAHAIEHGGADHSHDGVVCEVSLAAAQQHIVIPPLPITTPFVPPIEANWNTVELNEVPRTFDGRAPPPRGPPAHR
jgi:hypothetical protein